MGWLRSKAWKENLLFASMIAAFMIVPIACRSWLMKLTLYQSLVVSQLLVQIPVVLYLLLTRQNPLRIVPFRRVKLVCIPLIIIMTYCLLPLTTVLNLVSQYFAGSGTSDLNAGLTGGFAINLLFVAVMPAISEEFACRGIFFGKLKEHSAWGGILISALFFGLLHMNWNQFSYAFVIGIVFALTVTATGSIFGGMLMHFIFNGNSVLLMELLTRMGVDITQQTEIANDEMAQVTLASELFVLIVLTLYAALCLFAAALLYISIVKLMKREAYVAPLFGRFWKCPQSLPSVEEENQIEEKSLEEDWQSVKKRQNNYLDLIWLIAVAAAVVMMTL